MKFTYLDKDARYSKKREERIRGLMNGIRKFAWLPVRINGKEVIWLEHYMLRYNAQWAIVKERIVTKPINWHVSK